MLNKLVSGYLEIREREKGFFCHAFSFLSE